MTKQELLELLAEAECELFHLAADEGTAELKDAHCAARAALETYAKSIGIIA